MRRIDSHAIVYTAAVSLLVAALLLTCNRLGRRYGAVAVDRMHGLARPMPRLATIIALLVMAFIGFPPFAVFSAFASILLHGAAANFGALIVLVVCWFAAAWCLFRMMQRLLFGPHRNEIKYEDLRTGELAGFALLLLLLMLAGTIQPDWLEPQRLERLQTIAMEMVPWRK
jgi:NADH-quinone oxidoreductase subunit M